MMPEEQKTNPISQNFSEAGKQFSAPRYLQKIKHPLLTGFIAAGLFSFVLYVFAVPPATPYIPGFTLEPGCAPTDTNCTVYAPVTYSGANNDIDLNGHSITNATGTFGTLQVGGYSFPTSTGAAGQVLTAINSTGTLNWTSPGTTGIFVGITNTVATGSLTYGADTGYAAGDLICSNDPKTGFSGSHMCSASEMLHTIATDVSKLSTSGYAWVNNGVQGSANDCNGHYSTATDSDSGMVWFFTNDGTGGQAWLQPCTPDAASLACCK